MDAPLLSLNAGSSSLKFAVFEPAAARNPEHLPTALLRGEIDRRDDHAVLNHAAAGEPEQSMEPPSLRGDIGAETAWLIDWLQRERGLAAPAVVAHRIVHGGLKHTRAVRIDARVETELRRLSSLAPLHQGPGLQGVRAARQALPGAVQVACFDTAFHAGHEDSERRYAVPRRWHERGYQRYGFHGLSFDAISRRLPALLGHRAAGCVVVAHLGSGASVCGMRALRSVSTSMGFTALDGLVMSTRCGSLDPGLVLRWVEHDRLSAKQISDMLYHESGLLGVSEISGDMRELLASGDPRARQAVDLFVASVVRHVGATAAAIGGLDALVFTGGIGTHQAPVRAAVAQRLGWMGVELDEAANAAGALLVSGCGSRVAVLALPTDEEAVMALQAIEACAGTQPATPRESAAENVLAQGRS
ncbi:MAG: acetate/propionate family kinase [Betaproteobacteria bacterium]|nr:acetate/propionate family kinase [Betaproteobacteria bacterium]